MVAAKKRRVTGPTESEQLAARLAVVEAERAALRMALGDVLSTLPAEWAPAEVQAKRRNARAVYEETKGDAK